MGFEALADVVSGIRRFEYDSDLQLLEDAWDYALVIDFMGLDDWRAYRDHPRHLALAGRFMLLIDDIARVQYQIVPAGLTPRSTTCTGDARRSA